MAPLPPDPYKVLGVSKDAQTPEIRSAHRKLVLRCHPDKVQDPKLKEEKQNEFQRVQQAYELLINDDERQKYDDKVRLEDLRRQMKEKAHVSSPKPSAKYSGEFEIRTPEMRSSAFKSSPSPAKVFATFSRYDDDYSSRGPRIFETKSSRSSKRDSSFSERSRREREAEKEREREKDKDRERERRRKADKEALKAEKKRQEKIRDREIKRDAEEKHRARYAKPSVDVYDDDMPKSERKRSSKKHDDKGGRTSPRDDKPISSSRPPLSKSFYSSTDRSTYESASFYVQASRNPAGLTRSYSHSGRAAYPPAAPSPPPTNPKKAFVTSDSESDEYVRRSAAPSRRGSGDGPRVSRERPAYHKSSKEVLDDHIPAAASPAARHTASFSRTPPMSSSPPRYDLPRTNSMPQPPSGFSRPSPNLARAHTFAAAEHQQPRGRDRSRTQPQIPTHLESSESEDERERERERDRRYRSRKTASPEPMPQVWRYEVDSGRRTRRIPPPVDMDAGGHGHYMYAQPVRVSEARIPPIYRESSHSTLPPNSRYPSVKTSKYDSVRYSEYPPYGNPVRA